MKGYHDLYLKCDVLFLADVFQKIRKSSLKIMGYLSVPASSWDAMLNVTKVELKLISDVDTYQTYSYISKRCRNAKNKYLKFCDPKEQSKHIIYLGPSNFLCYVYVSSNKWI